MKNLTLSFPFKGIKQTITSIFLCILIFSVKLGKTQCSCDPLSYGSYSVNPTVGQTADDFDVAGDDWSATTVLLQFDFIIDVNFVINSTDIAIMPGVEITVNSGKTLVIYNDSYISAKSGEDMWESIHVLAGGTVVIQESTIAHAEMGVFSDNTTTSAADFQITNGTLFCNNDIGIYIDAYTGGVHPGLVEDTEICALSLIDPVSGSIGLAGIYGDGINGTSSINVGNGNFIGIGSEFNTFHDLQYGIFLVNANATITNNKFNDILNSTSLGIGIYGRASVATPCHVDIGPSTTSAGVYNYFESVEYGIALTDYYSSNIMKNIFVGNATGSSYDMRKAIFIDGCPQTHFITFNEIENAHEYGIYCNDNESGDFYIRSNEIINTPSLSTSLVRTGIFYDLNAPETTDVVITGNTIENVQCGIFARHVQNGLQISTNIIDFKFPTGGLDIASGISIEDCYFAKLDLNILDGHGATSSSTLGIRIEASEGFRCYFANDISNCGYGIYCDQDSPDGNIVCNTITNCTRGVCFNDIDDGNIGPIQGNFSSPFLPSDNKWYPSTGDPSTWGNRTIMTGGTDGSTLTWRYRDDDEIYDMVEAGGTGLNITITGTVISPILSAAGPSGEDICEFTEYELPRLSGAERKLGVENSLKLTDDLDLTGYFATYYQNLSNKLNEGATINDIYLLLDAGLNMINNDSLYIEPDTATEHLEMLIAETNLENYRNIFSLINIREYNEAETVLAGIETINSLEDNMSAVIDIYLQSINEDGVLEITEENRASLIGIATQKNNDAGKAVYFARAVLDTVICFPPPDFEDMEEREINSISFSPYPNPTNGIFYIEISKYFEPDKILVNDLAGAVILNMSIGLLTETTYNMDITQFKAGIYLFTFIDKSGNQQFGKIIKL